MRIRICDPGSEIFLDPGSGIRDGKIRIRNITFNDNNNQILNYFEVK
jgi:hypothetical protein